MNPRSGRSFMQNFSRNVKLKYNSIVSIIFASIRIFFMRKQLTAVKTTFGIYLYEFKTR